MTKNQRNKQKRLYRLSMPMLHQLFAYAEEAGREGWFYGNEAQFRKRHQRILKWLTAIRERRID